MLLSYKSSVSILLSSNLFINYDNVLGFNYTFLKERRVKLRSALRQFRFSHIDLVISLQFLMIYRFTLQKCVAHSCF